MKLLSLAFNTPSHANCHHTSAFPEPSKNYKTSHPNHNPHSSYHISQIQKPNMSSIVQQYHDAEDKGNQAWLRQDYKSAKTYYQKSPFYLNLS
jgi:hypothetical protein